MTIYPKHDEGKSNRSVGRLAVIVIAVLTSATVLSLCGCGSSDIPDQKETARLSHEQTLDWVDNHRAWRRAKKTKPIWARPVEADEVGQEFQTADHAVERAQDGYWLCVGVAGEPWFQKAEKIDAKYDLAGDENKQFGFDDQPHSYRFYEPKEGILNWAAQVHAEDIEGFYIKPGYDMDHPLYSPSGGYVVKGDVPDPYQDDPNDVWLVQQPLFESTYELLP